MTDRTTLPNRRPQAVHKINLNGTTLHLGIGFDPETGQPSEVFITGGKEGTDVQLLVQHVAILISIALQHGVTPEAMGKAMARGDLGAGWPSLLVPAVLEKIQAERAAG